MRELMLEAVTRIAGGSVNNEHPLAWDHHGGGDGDGDGLTGEVGETFTTMTYMGRATVTVISAGTVESSFGGNSIFGGSSGINTSSGSFGWNQINDWFDNTIDPWSDTLFDWDGDGNSMEELAVIAFMAGTLEYGAGIAGAFTFFGSAGTAIGLTDYFNDQNWLN